VQSAGGEVVDGVSARGVVVDTQPTQEGRGLKKAQGRYRTRSRLKQCRGHRFNTTKRGPTVNPILVDNVRYFAKQQSFGNDRGTTIRHRFSPMQHKTQEKQ